jgi:hypothetical protein
MSEQWRAMSPDELHTTRETSLSGPLRIILLCAAAIASAPVVSLLAMAALTGADAFLFLAAFVTRALFSPDLSNQIASLSLIPQIALFVWAAVTALMGFSRNASTPHVSSILLIIWAAMAMLSQIAIRYAIVRSGADFVSQLSLLPYLIFDIAVAAAYWGYMHDSRAANIYFRRRVRAS